MSIEVARVPQFQNTGIILIDTPRDLSQSTSATLETASIFDFIASSLKLVPWQARGSSITGEYELHPFPNVGSLDWASLNSTLSELQSLPEAVQHSSLGFDKIGIQAIAAARKFITRFFWLVADNNFEWVSPHITTEGDGGISFEWWRRDKVLTIFVDSQGSIESLMTWGPNIWEDMEGTIEPSNIKLLELWKRMQV